MLTITMISALGAVSHGLLAALFAFVWRGLAVRWAALEAVSFAAFAVLDGVVVAGHFRNGLGDHPLSLNMAIALIGMVTMTGGLVEFVQSPSPHSAWSRWLPAGYGVAVFAAVAFGAVTYRETLILFGGYVVGWIALFSKAFLRERTSGFGFLVVVLLLYLVTVAVRILGLGSQELLTFVSAFPATVLGMSLLCIGVLRSHRLVDQELVARRRAEDELRTLNEELEERVQLRTAELREIIDGLNSFNRTISHDLRGPLTGIAMVAHGARAAVASGDRASADGMLRVIEEQAAASDRLVTALLALARAGDAELHLQRVDTEELVRAVLATLAVPLGLEALPVHVEPLPEVYADPDLLRQVYVNLLGNALKFSAGTGRPRVEVGAVGERSQPTLFVRDNGVGFSAAEARELFRPFKRLHGQQFAGFGIGLSIVRRIVERHGGTAWADGSPGHGATIYFTLGRPTVPRMGAAVVP